MPLPVYRVNSYGYRCRRAPPAGLQVRDDRHPPDDARIVHNLLRDSRGGDGSPAREGVL